MASSAPPSAPPSNGNAVFPVGLRVLLIDEDEDALRSISDMCYRFGYRVTTVTDTALAQQMLLNTDFDVVICEANMPGNNGVQMLQFAASLEAWPYPFVLMSRDVTFNSISEAFSWGADAYFGKPVIEHEINKLWHLVLRRQYLFDI